MILMLFVVAAPWFPDPTCRSIPDEEIEGVDIPTLLANDADAVVVAVDKGEFDEDDEVEDMGAPIPGIDAVVKDAATSGELYHSFMIFFA